MDHFDYISGKLHADDVPLEQIAESVGTPFYCYSASTFERHARVFMDAFKSVNALTCFAVKANSNLAILKLLGSLGMGADVVSGGELKRAMKAGIPAERIVFSGVGKTVDEMRLALEVGIYQYNVESVEELHVLSAVADDMGKTASISFRINPHVDAGTHHKTATGRKEDKFGISWERAEEVYGLAATLPGISIVGVDVHIGSQLTELEPFRLAFERVMDLVLRLRSKGHAISRIDLGGGLGIPYDTDIVPPGPDEYGAMICKMLADVELDDVQLILEPGRMIAGNAGVLVSKVLFVKKGDHRDFLILDAGMNDLMRPALYDAYHAIRPVKEAADEAVHTYDVVGPVCETGDTFAKQRDFPPMEAGELVAFSSAGAYGAVMSNSYNSRDLVPEVLVKGADWHVIRDRVTLDEMLERESFPDWMK